MATRPKSVPPKSRTAVRARAPRGRVALTRERIVDAALALVEAEGLAALTTRRLGHALGCEAMSIYHHFPSKQHLLDGMVDHVIADFALPPPGPSPVERVRRVCYAYRELAHRHPRFFPYAAVHRLNTPTGVRFIEGVLGVVASLVPGRELAVRYFRALGYYLVGGALDETAGYASGPSAAEPVSDAYLAEHCPRLVAAAPYFKPAQWDATFALGIEALLADMQRHAPPAKATG